MLLRQLLITGLLCIGLTVSAQAQIHKGRVLEDRKTFSISLSLGTIFDLDGEVQETTRPIEQIGGPTSGAPPENYSWGELGFDDSTSSIGLRVEKMWRYVTLQANGFYANPGVRGTADRNYYIGVESITFDGTKYEYMQIPEGTTYSGDIEAYGLDFRLQITPVTFGNPDRVSLTPWVHLGLFAFTGDYDINAGEARGVTQYENPPRDYVIAGRGTGTAGLVVPELGLGGEVRIRISNSTALSLQGHIAFLKLKTSSGDFGVSSRNEKAVDVDYISYSLLAQFEMELNPNMNLLVGAELLHRTGDAEVRARGKSREEMLALREKFDKEVSFEMTSFAAFVGLQF